MKFSKIKIRFINYRKVYNGTFPISGWLPTFNKYWMGDIWKLEWRGYGISLDKRENWIADMVDPERKRHEISK